MKENQSLLQKAGLVLSTSSETFMLIALVSLFALPFVIASNLEPSIKDAEQRVAAIQTQTLTQEGTTPIALVSPTVDSDVLGVQASQLPFEVTPNTSNLKYFDAATPSVTEKSYSIEVATTQVFGQLNLFTLKNNSGTKQVYKFSVVNKAQGAGKYLMVDTAKYELTSSKLPDYINLDSAEEVTFSLMNSESKTATKAIILVEQTTTPAQ